MSERNSIESQVFRSHTWTVVMMFQILIWFRLYSMLEPYQLGSALFSIHPLFAVLRTYLSVRVHRLICSGCPEWRVARDLLHLHMGDHDRNVKSGTGTPLHRRRSSRNMCGSGAYWCFNQGYVSCKSAVASTCGALLSQSHPHARIGRKL